MDTLSLWPQDDNPPMKRCFSCPEGQQWHPATVEYFHVHRKTKDGFQTQCKACRQKKWIKPVKKKPGLPVNPICDKCGSQKVKIGKAEKWGCPSCSSRRNSEWTKQYPERANARNRAYRAKHPERAGRIARNSKLIINFGMSIEEYEALLKAQGYVCAICKKPEVKKHRNGKLWSLSVDHDHKTGKIRGLLCSACNVGLANFREDIEALETAIRYLKGEVSCQDISLILSSLKTAPLLP